MTDLHPRAGHPHPPPLTSPSVAVESVLYGSGVLSATLRSIGLSRGLGAVQRNLLERVEGLTEGRSVIVPSDSASRRAATGLIRRGLVRGRYLVVRGRRRLILDRPIRDKEV